MNQVFPESAPPALEKTAVRLSVLSIVCNTLLSLFKLLAGLLAHSGAMVSDAVHSASDVLSSFIVIVGVKLAGKAPDKEHPYGHERFECVAAIVLAVVLLVTGLFIGSAALEKIGASEAAVETPGRLAAIAAVVSILVKEALYWYTRHHAKRIDSGALMAEAWHHRSDALSSIGALVGIVGARMGHPLLDPVASLVICCFIAKAAVDIFRDAVSKMVDRSCSEEMEEALRSCALAQPEVLGVDQIRTRVFANRVYADIEIACDGSISLTEGHAVAERVHHAIEKAFPKIKHIMVHVNPYGENTP
ncbi:MAG: cation transporter [Oscillospiraceae bacterium]|nr:cation transporter [Oscillospiraceae bacterium]